jgi:deoxyxylulose-5-phosphate synthase
MIISHGSIAINILESKLFNTDEFSLLLFNEIPNSLDNTYLKIFDEANSIKVLEDVVYAGSLGSRVTRFMVQNKLNKPFEWVGVNGKNVKSAGGTEEYLRSRELGSNYIGDLFKD